MPAHCRCFNTQPPEGGWLSISSTGCAGAAVSTHSRLKAAGMDIDLQQTRPVRFNTQPPEGGWVGISRDFKVTPSFNTQPPEGGWLGTHFRKRLRFVRFNTQPPEGGWLCPFRRCTSRKRFNTQPPEGGWLPLYPCLRKTGRFNTQPPEGGWDALAKHFGVTRGVSTHSRLKAAGASLKSLAPSGFAAPISPNSQEKCEREYNTAFSVTPAFAIS